MQDMAGIAFPADRIFSQTVRSLTGKRCKGKTTGAMRHCSLHILYRQCLHVLSLTRNATQCSFCTSIPVKLLQRGGLLQLWEC